MSTNWRNTVDSPSPFPALFTSTSTRPTRAIPSVTSDRSVTSKGAARALPPRHDFFYHGLHPLPAEIVHHYGRTLACQRLRDAGPDVLAGPGHQRHPACEIEHATPSEGEARHGVGRCSSPCAETYQLPASRLANVASRQGYSRSHEHPKRRTRCPNAARLVPKRRARPAWGIIDTSRDPSTCKGSTRPGSPSGSPSVRSPGRVGGRGARHR
jgi:hypothetical protein